MQIFYKILLITLVSYFNFSCGNQDNNRGEAPTNVDLNLSPFEQLSGSWNGIYRPLSQGQPVEDAAEASMKLNIDGAFQITLKDTSGAEVLGEWSEFQGRSLIMKIRGSSIPRIGSAGKLLEPSYELRGQSLRVSTELFELKLTKNTPDSGDNSGGSRPDMGSLGSWSCESADGRVTSIKLASDSTFSMTSLKSGERLFLATGNFANQSPQIFILTPTSVSDQLPNGSFFQLKVEAMKGLLTLMVHPERQIFSFGTCRRSN